MTLLNFCPEVELLWRFLHLFWYFFIVTLTLAHTYKDLYEVEVSCCLIKKEFGFCSQENPKFLECV